MSKASRRSSRTVRGASGRPAASGSTGSQASNPARPASPDTNPGGPPTVDASSLAGATPTGRPATPRPAGGRPPGSRPAGSRPAGSSRPRRTLYQPSFFDRHRTALIGAAAAIIVALVGAFFFFSVTASAYSCGTITQPAPAATPLPNGSPGPLGQAQPDMGNLHIAVGSNQHYAYCPPASGSHYNNIGIDGPIPAKYYGPDEGTRPEGWIHNLEHGAVVILYNCKMGACDDATLAALQAIPQNFPDSPICKVKAGNLAPVIARFDDMPAPFAALVWDRLLYLNTLDVNEIKQFYATQGELYNPEPQCARPSPGPSAGPSSAPSAAPSVAPSGSAGTPSSSPASSASPAAS
ncbi:MAG: DUF3105 domain-containing protein [Candidatus Limnocylindrales bacterium]